MNHDDVDNTFSYHAPFGNQAQRYEELRAKARELAHLYIDLVPASREQSMAITQLQLSVMCANAGIACNEKRP